MTAKWSQIKGVAFDLDGVIADTAKFHAIAWRKIADELGVAWSDELAAGLKGISRMESLELIMKTGDVAAKYTPAQKEALAAKKNANYLSLIKTLTPADILPGMSEFIHSLKQAGYKLVVASASRNAPTILQQLQLDDSFDGVVDPAAVAHGKPAPDIYEAAAKMMQLPNAEVAGVEDAIAGVTAIKDAGQLAIGIGDLPQADICFTTTAEVTQAKLQRHLG